MIDAATLKVLIDYDPATGVFRWKTRDRAWFQRVNQWKTWNLRYAGGVAGNLNPQGYRLIAVIDRQYLAHRLAWLMVHGAWPTNQIDHINGDRDDNRIENLRDVTGAENARNRRLQADNATGRTGVTAYPFQGQLRFVARIRVGGKLHHLGYFATVEEAAEARRAAEIKHGFHINHGSRPKTRTPLKGRGFEKSRRFPALTSSEVE